MITRRCSGFKPESAGSLHRHGWRSPLKNMGTGLRFDPGGVSRVLRAARGVSKIGLTRHRAFWDGYLLIATGAKVSRTSTVFVSAWIVCSW